MFPSPKWLLDRVTILRYTYTANRVRSLDVACHFPHHCSTTIHRLLAVFFISTEEVKCFLHLTGVILHNVSFHRCYWSRKTVSSCFQALEILHLVRSVLIGDSVAYFIRWKQIFCSVLHSLEANIL